MLKNIFKKIQKKTTTHSDDIDTDASSTKNIADTLATMPGAPDVSKMNMMQKFAWKQFQKMSPEKQRDVMKKAMTPKNVEKNKDQIIGQLEEMKAAGMMSDDQYRLAKRKLGIK